ncbi:MAG: serine/threonine protein kinase, partial [Myxococcaceae bacterium]|nr:serine/threonine protein kinase [Myxococcaceae bacterium]
VVDVFDVGRDGDILYIVMELLEGKPLSELLHDSSLTLEEALIVLLRAMEGVAAAHEHGVVHRDLKPDNIFVCVGASGRLDDPRVLDFGISKLEDAAGDQLTRTGVALGTPYYMSMEQLKGQRDLDARVDVYALGVILYEAIAGDPPFVADSVSALAIKVITEQPVHLGQLRPDLPEGLADVVMKALSRERDDRHRSVRALIEALRAYVPRSAGLFVPEGQGRLLRTPRSNGAHAALNSPLPVSVRDATEPYHPTVTDPPSAPTGESPLIVRPAWPRQVAMGAAIGLLTVGAAFLTHRYRAGDSSAPGVAGSPAGQLAAPPHLPEPAAHAADAPTTVLSAATPKPSVSIEPVLPQRADPVAAEGAARDAGSATSRRPASQARGAGRKSNADRATPPANAAIESAQPATPPSPGSSRKSAAGRAGELGSDEF